MKATQEFLAVKNSNHPISHMLEDSDLRKAYNTQYRNAKRRGIGFQLSYEEWLLIWVASGCLHLRGKQAGQYQMCRDKDSGDYVLGNVYIAQMEENLHSAHFGKKKKPEHRRKLAANFAKCRKYVTLTANGVFYGSMTECANAHDVSVQCVMARLKSNSPSFKDWKVQKVVRGKPSNVIKFQPRAEEIDLSEMDFEIDLSEFADEIDYQKLAQGELQ